jgi:putative spermidine/putrescine transport system substrate-binding protein
LVRLLVICALAASTLAGVGTFGAPAPGGAAAPVVVVGYGGEYKDIFMKTIGEPFQKASGMQITYDEGGVASQNYAKIRATQGDPGWDLAIVTSFEAVQGAKEGLLRKITDADVPNLKLVYPALRRYAGDYGAPEEIQQMLLVYNPKYVVRPDSWGALWDPRYKGHVLVFDPVNIMGIYTLIMAAKLDGGDQANIEPGFKRFEGLRGQLRAFLDASTTAITLFQQGEVWLLTYWDGRTAYYIDQGLPMKALVPREGTVALVNALIIPKGARNPAGAYRLIDFWLSKRAQAAWARAYTVGPTEPGIRVPAGFSDLHITSLAQLDKDVLPDLDLIVRNRAQWSQRLKEIMAR